MKYIYIDESGDLGKQTKYFVFGAILTNNPKQLDNIIRKTRKKYKKHLGNIPEIKGHKTEDYIIKKILHKLNNTNCKIIGIIIDKTNIYKITQNYDYNIIYDTIASKLAEMIIITSSTSIIIDKCKNKENEMINFNMKFINKLNNSHNYPVEIKHANSIHYQGLQIADLIAWSIFQCAERNNNEFISLIDNKTIKLVYEE
ncbi:MAG: DUF3800 domain-containing protein [Methanosphaera sp.]|nr:DUF3800 domain-containing protein [Methanosphaera sp.]